MTRVSAPTGKLSDLEAAVLRHAADGLTIEATARLLDSSVPAIQDARHRLLGKLGANSMPHAVHLAHLAGVLRKERHGDHAGFTAHVRHGEDPWACQQGCPAGERAYRAERRRARQQADQQREAAA